MRRIVLYDNSTVDSRYVSMVCREILMWDTLVKRIVCSCMDENDRMKFTEYGFEHAEEVRWDVDDASSFFEGNELSSTNVHRIPEAEILKAAQEETIDGIDIVTGDATLIGAIRTARLYGKEVRVFGNAMTTPNKKRMQTSVCDASFIRQCDRFCYLEILSGMISSACLTTLDEIVSDCHHIIIEERERNGAVKLQDLHATLLRLHPEYDARNYGYTGLLELLAKKAPNIRTYREDGCTYLEYVDDREQVERFITNYLAKRDNKVEDMQELLDALTEEFERFDTRLYGYTSDIAFFLSFPKLEIYNNKGVKLKQVFKLK